MLKDLVFCDLVLLFTCCLFLRPMCLEVICSYGPSVSQLLVRPSMVSSIPDNIRLRVWQIHTISSLPFVVILLWVVFTLVFSSTTSGGSYEEATKRGGGCLKKWARARDPVQNFFGPDSLSTLILAQIFATFPAKYNFRNFLPDIPEFAFGISSLSTSTLSFEVGLNYLTHTLSIYLSIYLLVQHHV